MFSVSHIVFIILTVLSHIGASLFFAQSRFNKVITAIIWMIFGIIFLILPPDTPAINFFLSFGLHLVLFFITTFFAKPRFNKVITAIIWLIYGIVFLILPPDTPAINFFVSFGLHLVLFFTTTAGRTVEKGFLFFSYATTYTCFSSLFNILNNKLNNTVAIVASSLVLMTIMQIILYMVLLPSFRKVAMYIREGWAKFYGVVISFWVLIVGQSVFTLMKPMTTQQTIIFLFTMLAFCVTYIAIFNSMKNIVELSREKQKSLHTELLQTQVDAQAKEAKIVSQNRHDMRHHYQALMSLATDGEMDKIVDYLKLQSESIEAMTTGRFCENETINSILKVYHKKAKNQNIAIDICAAVKPNISVPSPALVTIVANTLENALHGASDSKSATPYIKVSIKHKAGRLVISCENSCIPSLDFKEMPDYLQGIGIHSIIFTTEKYNGSCRFSANNGKFTATIIMDE